MYFMNSTRMNKVTIPLHCLPCSTFVYSVYWHARNTYKVSTIQTSTHVFQKCAKQNGTPSGTWFSSHLCCAALVVKMVSRVYKCYLQRNRRENTNQETLWLQVDSSLPATRFPRSYSLELSRRWSSSSTRVTSTHK